MQPVQFGGIYPLRLFQKQAGGTIVEAPYADGADTLYLEALEQFERALELQGISQHWIYTSNEADPVFMAFDDAEGPHASWLNQKFSEIEVNRAAATQSPPPTITIRKADDPEAVGEVCPLISKAMEEMASLFSSLSETVATTVFDTLTAMEPLYDRLAEAAKSRNQCYAICFEGVATDQGGKPVFRFLQTQITENGPLAGNVFATALPLLPKPAHPEDGER